MLTRPAAALFALIIAALLAYGSADARVSELNLKNTDPEGKAIARVEIDHIGFIPSDRLLKITAFRLKPNSVYSVWFVGGGYGGQGEREPGGLTGSNYFRTDGSGSGHYYYHTDKYEIDHNLLEVAYHPDGDPANTDDMVVVLRGRMYD